MVSMRDSIGFIENYLNFSSSVLERLPREITDGADVALIKYAQGCDVTVWKKRKNIFSPCFFQFPLEFPDAANNEDQNRCSSSNIFSSY